MAIYRHCDFDKSLTDLDNICHAGGNILGEDPRFPEQAYDCTPVTITSSGRHGPQTQPIALCALDCWDVSGMMIGLAVGQGEVTMLSAVELIQAIAISSGLQVVHNKDGVHLMRAHVSGDPDQAYSLQSAADAQAAALQEAEQFDARFGSEDELLEAARELGIDLRPGSGEQDPESNAEG